MNIKIICTGKIKEKYWSAAIQEYLKRLTVFAKVEIAEVTDEKAPEHISRALQEQIKDKEGQRMVRHIKPGDFIIALAVEGQMMSSEKMAHYLADLALQGKSDLVFIIGGSLGLSTRILQQADLLLSFSQMTFQHQLMRVILLEQIYRCFKINHNQPYHK